MILVPRGDLAVPEDRGRGWPNPKQKAEKRDIESFCIDRTEVSCAAYAAFLREVKDAKLRERIAPSGWKPDEKGIPEPPKGSGRLPVTGIPYEGAAAFAAFHGKHLPSEDEWERAARGDAGLKFPWGNDWIEGRAIVAVVTAPAPVGSATQDASPFGVLDLCGNVSELCATSPDGKPVKKMPRESDQVVIRGGNFADKADEAANDWRYVIGGTARSPKVGFRCVMDEREYEKRFGKKP
jgi:formylglycine-generating enzyme required for sulfatase activity